MINNTVYTYEIKSEPVIHDKTKEREEIAALTAAFMAKGGKIKHIQSGVRKGFESTHKSCAAWAEQYKVHKMMSELLMSKAELAKLTGFTVRKINAFLAGLSIPDSEQKSKILKALRNAKDQA